MDCAKAEGCEQLQRCKLGIGKRRENLLEKGEKGKWYRVELKRDHKD